RSSCPARCPPALPGAGWRVRRRRPRRGRAPRHAPRACRDASCSPADRARGPARSWPRSRCCCWWCSCWWCRSRWP
ncbi:MAG: hypothetical protein AVDCRST_MAG54-504, partial [uncultured Actinomycetospora sp.]